jgi:hypothetical protein
MAVKTQTSLTSLERLEAQIRALPDGTPQGAAWEAALVGWVNGGGHPDLVKGWGWKQWPGRAKAGLPRIERGVDLIAEDRAGRLVAIQAKFRNDPDSPVKTGEVQKFVGAYRKHFPRRMLISNASSRARGIMELGDNDIEVQRTFSCTYIVGERYQLVGAKLWSSGTDEDGRYSESELILADGKFDDGTLACPPSE